MTRLKVRLVRKLALLIDDIDLSKRQVGDVLNLPTHEARLLIAEGWAERVDDPRRSQAADTPRDPRKP